MTKRDVLQTKYDKPLIHVVVVELHHHSELIRNLIKVFEYENFKMSLITVPEVLGKINPDVFDGKNWLNAFCKDENEAVKSFIERMMPIFNSADIIYFNTVRHFWEEMSDIPIKVPTIIRIHNAHADLAPLSHFYQPVLKFPAIFSHLVRKVLIAGEWRKRENFLKNIDYFMFPNQAITEYVVNKNWISSDRILPPVMPFGFLGENKDSAIKRKDGVVTIGITGTVNNNRKNYRLVYFALKKCISKFKYPVRLVLLGKASKKNSSDIIDNFRSLESAKFCMEFSNSYLSQEEFNKKISYVDFLLAPIRVETRFRKYRERYGKSKMSGIENDILLYRKPSLVTSEYIIKGDMANVVEYADPYPEVLADRLLSWVNEQTYEKLKENFHSLEEYNPQKMSNKFHELCFELMDNGKVR